MKGGTGPFSWLNAHRLGKLPREKEENVNNNKRLVLGAPDLVLCQEMKQQLIL